MNRRRVFAACLQETWRVGEETRDRSGALLISVGLSAQQQTKRGSQGVGFVLSRRAVACWEAGGSVRHVDLGARVAAIRLVCQDEERREVGIHLISAYAPIGCAADSEWDEFFDALSVCVARARRGDVVVIGTDANSSMGVRELGDEESWQFSPVGPHGNPHLNDSGRRMLTYLATKSLAVATTYFKKRRYSTWINPCSRKEHQNDHFLMQKGRLALALDAGLCESLIGSDHRAVKCRLRICAFKKKRTDPRREMTRLDWSYLDVGSDELREKFCSQVSATVEDSVPCGGDDDSSCGGYSRVAKAVFKVARELLPVSSKAEPGWFDEGRGALLPLIHERNRLTVAYFDSRTDDARLRLRDARLRLKRAVVVEKNAWIQRRMRRMNDATTGRGSTKECWDVCKELKRGLAKSRPSSSVKMKKRNGTLAQNAQQNADVFREHFRLLYGRAPSFDPLVLDILTQRPVDHEMGLPPTEAEIKGAVAYLHDTSPGDTGIKARAWKVLSSDASAFILIRDFVLEFWESEAVPKSWETGLLAVLPKKGDLSLPGNYRGIMMLESSYKIIAVIIHQRLSPLCEELDHESQCGFRPARGCCDATFTVKMAMKKRREHGLESWIYFLDLVKAFDRVPRELLWMVMLKFGVSPKLVSLLKALHASVSVKFTIDEVECILESIIGVKQGDILGPILFIFFIAAVMITFRLTHNYDLCIYRTKADFVLHGRSHRARGNEFAVPDSLYADDSAVIFCSRSDVDEQVPRVNAHFRRWGMEVHEGSAAKDSKSEVLFVAAPEHMYDDPETYTDDDGPRDLSNVTVGDGRFIPVVSKFKYLGSMMTNDCRDNTDVDSRIASATAAFAALRKCVFAARDVWLKVKQQVYCGLILSILIYGSESWCLTEVLYNRVRRFHARCARAMCRVTMKHVRKHRISTTQLLERLGIESIDTYIARRQARWAGHVARMDMGRLPRKMLSSWVRHPRPTGAPQFTYARGLHKALRRLGIDRDSWHESAQDREQWRATTNPRDATPPAPPAL